MGELLCYYRGEVEAPEDYEHILMGRLLSFEL